MRPQRVSSLRVVVGCSTSGFDGPVDGVEDASRVVEEDAPGREQRHAARGAAEQGRAELGFERADLTADGWLSDEEPLGGAPDVALLGDGDEGTELREAHPPSLPSMNAGRQGGASDQFGIGLARGRSRIPS